MKKILWCLLGLIIIGIIAYFVSGKIATMLGLGSAALIAKKKKENKNIDEEIKKNEQENEELSDDINELELKEEKLKEEYNKITKEGEDNEKESNGNIADRLNDILADADESSNE
jgi:cell division protein FtsB